VAAARIGQELSEVIVRDAIQPAARTQSIVSEVVRFGVFVI
jgi:hypothetical protein